MLKDARTAANAVVPIPSAIMKTTMVVETLKITIHQHVHPAIVNSEHRNDYSQSMHTVLIHLNPIQEMIHTPHQEILILEISETLEITT